MLLYSIDTAIIFVRVEAFLSARSNRNIELFFTREQCTRNILQKLHGFFNEKIFCPTICSCSRIRDCHSNLSNRDETSVWWANFPLTSNIKLHKQLILEISEADSSKDRRPASHFRDSFCDCGHTGCSPIHSSTKKLQFLLREKIRLRNTRLTTRW